MARATNRAIALARELSDSGDVLRHLQHEGFSKVDCVRATTAVLRVRLRDAKRLVHTSGAWGHRRVHDERFHRRLTAVLEQLAATRTE